MGKTAGQYDKIDIGKFRVGMPDHCRFLSRDLFERHGRVAVAVGSREHDDGRLHGEISISYFSMTVLASSCSHISFRLARALVSSRSESSRSITLPWRTSPTARKPRLFKA